jgi:hypothetical protein
MEIIVTKTSFDTGYAKPPAHTRFKPGRSGNPRGRPRKERYEPPQMTGLDIYDQPFAKMIEEEGARPVEVSDGKGKTEEIPAFQAVIRSLVHQAAKGSRLAARQFVELYSSLQRERREEKQSSLESVLRMKLLMEEHSDTPEALLLKEHGPDLERTRINPNGLIDYGVGPSELTPLQIAKLEDYRERVADNLGDARDRLAAADNALMREVVADRVERLEQLLREINDDMPDDRQLPLFETGSGEQED